MNDLFNYSNALRETLSEHQQDLQDQAEKDSEFNTKIQEALTPFTTEFLREGIPPAVQKLGSALSEKLGLKNVKAISRIAKNLKEGGVPKAISGEIQEGLNRVGKKQETPANPGEAEDNELVPPREVVFQNPLYDPEGGFEPEEVEDTPNNLYSFGDILNDKNLFKQFVKQEHPELTNSGGEEDIEEARQQLLQDPTLEHRSMYFLNDEPAVPTPGSSSNQIGRLLREGSPQEPTPETPEEGTRPTTTPEGPTTTPETPTPTAGPVSEEPSPTIPSSAEDLENAGKKAITNTLKDTLPEELLPETGLDLDPLTAPIGLLLGLGSLFTEIFAQKHPVLPQTTTQPSTQFGV